MTLVQLFTAIANAIREKRETSSSIKAEDFPEEILQITTTPTGTITITENGEYNVANYGTAIVNVPTININFENGYSLGTSVFDGTPGVYRSSTTARATTHNPFKNDGYTFTVTDSSKYQVNVIGVLNNTKHYRTSSGIIDGYWYEKDNKAVNWTSSDTSSSPFVWVALKKLDNTSFTQEELANNAKNVITISLGD